ncbi:hypothetical protein [Lachnoclostridium sp. Marseille-P6806]|uniref:hypothetical protein n=1 Tax=Lachnoclostridium sp. Marseille-P6806 TaxID=2364793 RepID=UPI0010327585|nr:hypothetical protein [Lachnoclostridium sp. Marseille-P6806]
MTRFKLNAHPEIKEGQHAIFAPSQKFLTRDQLTTEQLDNIIRAKYAAQIGTIIHAEAARMILQKKSVTKAKVIDRIYNALWEAHIPDRLNTPELYLDTVLPYVKDAIGFDLIPEQPVVYQYPIAYGTVDAIRYNPVKHELRIHDLKTGKIAASLDQLIEYAAYFFLEYHLKPADTSIILCIYQNGEILTGIPKASDILPVMSRAIELTKYVKNNYIGGDNDAV